MGCATTAVSGVDAHNLKKALRRLPTAQLVQIPSQKLSVLNGGCTQGPMAPGTNYTTIWTRLDCGRVVAKTVVIHSYQRFCTCPMERLLRSNLPSSHSNVLQAWAAMLLRIKVLVQPQAKSLNTKKRVGGLYTHAKIGCAFLMVNFSMVWCLELLELREKLQVQVVLPTSTQTTQSKSGHDIKGALKKQIRSLRPPFARHHRHVEG